jgi:hypothetical protein
MPLVHVNENRVGNFSLDADLEENHRNLFLIYNYKNFSPPYLYMSTDKINYTMFLSFGFSFLLFLAYFLFMARGLLV